MELHNFTTISTTTSTRKLCKILCFPFRSPPSHTVLYGSISRGFVYALTVSTTAVGVAELRVGVDDAVFGDVTLAKKVLV